MKKTIILLVFVALGVATQSCEDATYNELEKTVLDDLKSGPSDDFELRKN